jgi:hypothetical protein
LLALSISEFDPQRTSASISFAVAKLVSALSMYSF